MYSCELNHVPSKGQMFSTLTNNTKKPYPFFFVSEECKHRVVDEIPYVCMHHTLNVGETVVLPYTSGYILLISSSTEGTPFSVFSQQRVEPGKKYFVGRILGMASTRRPLNLVTYVGNLFAK